MGDGDQTTVPFSGASAIEGVEDEVRVGPHEEATNRCQQQVVGIRTTHDIPRRDGGLQEGILGIKL